MRLATVADRWGSWGGASEEKESLELSAAMCRWRVTDAMLLENGPVRAALWVKMEGGRSRVEQIFSLCAGRDVLDVSARVYWNEEYRRLKVIMPVGDTADYEVPGGAVRRGPSGEVPGGRWVRVRGKGRTFVFASDALYAFNSRRGALMATICRSTRYAIGRIWPDGKDKWRPPVDAGELKFRYAISCGRMDPGRLSDELEQPPVALMVPPHPGRLPRCGSLADLKPGLLRIMALKPAEDGRGIVLRAQNTGKKAVPAASLRWLGEKIALEGSVLPWQIKSWRLSRISGRWRSEPSGALETRV
jgi:alpha-mannosidase